MMIQVCYVFLLLIGLGTIIWLVQYLHSKYLIQRDYTRKIAHILASLCSLIFLIEAISPYVVLVIALFFAALLWIGKRRNYFQAIDLRKSHTKGSYLLPISLLVTYLISRFLQDPLLFVLPVLILAISDPLAWLAGTYFRSRTRRIILFSRMIKKTIIGAIVFFLSSLTISFTVLAFSKYDLPSILIIPFIIAGTDTIVELLSPYGMDNLFVPLTTILILLMIH